MASVHPAMSSVLKEELTCPVCLDVYRDPHLLPCGHNFCNSCLRRIQRQAQRGRFHCPECRETYRGSGKFQKNFKLANIADDYRRQGRAYVVATASPSTSGEPTPCSSAPQPAKAQLSVPCDYCPPAGALVSGPGPGGDGASSPSSTTEAAGGSAPSVLPAVIVVSPAIKTCLKCEVSMCQEHVKPHLELPAFREHPLKDPLDDLRSRKCPSHDEIYRYYCLDDRVCVCNACTIEGGHSGHTMKTLKNTMRDLKVSLDKQLYRLERKYSAAEKNLHVQREKERQNRKFCDDSEQCINTLGEEMKSKVEDFISKLQSSTQTHGEASQRAIQKNVQRVSQDQVRLQEVRCGIEGLLMEDDPFRFIQAYRTTRKQCRRQLRKTMFYPEYVDMETDVLGDAMNQEMIQFLEVQLQSLIISTFDHLYRRVERAEEEEEEEEATEDEDEDELDDSSEEEDMRSEGEEEAEEEEEEEESDQSESGDDLYAPEGEDEEEEEEEVEEGELLRFMSN